MKQENRRVQAERLEAILPALNRVFAPDTGHPSLELPLAQLRVCTVLQDGPQPLCCVAERLKLSPSAVTQIADRLERAGLVERVAEAEDRRVRRLRLTEKGAEMMRSRRAMRVDRAAEALARLAPEDRAKLLDLLTAVLPPAEAGEAE